MKKFGSFAANLAAKELEKYDMEKMDDDVWDSLPEAERAAWILGLSEPGHHDRPDFFALSTSEAAWFVDGLTRARRARLGV